MKRRDFLKMSALTAGALGTGLHMTCGKTASRPNIIFILADDMGYGDIQAFNKASNIPTPHLNRLAEQGVRFTDAHSGSGVCSPTRYGVLTGRYAWRTFLKSGVLWPPSDKPMITRDRLTVAGMLKKQGYHTACFGKWHVGFEWNKNEDGEVDFNLPLKYGPTDMGFDEFLGIAGSLDMVPYVLYHNHNPSHPVTGIQEGFGFPRFIRKGPKEEGFEPAQVLDRLTKKAVQYIGERAAGNKPFFLYFPMTAPHKPVWPEKRFEGKTELGPYGDFIHQTDWTVGQVMKALDDHGLADNTMIVFTSDNGSYMFSRDREPDHIAKAEVQAYHPDHHRSNAHFRGTKADVWEGGHHVPFIVRWPGHTRPGSVCDETICLTDFTATCAEITNFSMPDDFAEDSFSLMDLIEGRSWRSLRAPVIHHSSNGTFALRDDKWKMVFGSGSGGREKPAGKPFEKPYFLFDMETDPSETINVIDVHPDIASRMEKLLKTIMEGKGSRFQTANTQSGRMN
jgi:arylsulfatase A